MCLNLLVRLIKRHRCKSKVASFAGVDIDCWKLRHHTLLSVSLTDGLILMNHTNEPDASVLHSSVLGAGMEGILHTFLIDGTERMYTSLDNVCCG